MGSARFDTLSSTSSSSPPPPPPPLALRRWKSEKVTDAPATCRCSVDPVACRSRVVVNMTAWTGASASAPATSPMATDAGHSARSGDDSPSTTKAAEERLAAGRFSAERLHAATEIWMGGCPSSAIDESAMPQLVAAWRSVSATCCCSVALS